MKLSEQGREFRVGLPLAAVCSVIYFFLVKDYAVGVFNNTTNVMVFTACSASDFELGPLYDVWKGRLAALLLSGGLFDFLVSHTSGSLAQLSFAFGLYQAIWLFLLLGAVTIGLRQSWLINLGILAGAAYDLLPASGLYIYPWDIPATLFFTL